MVPVPLSSGSGVWRWGATGLFLCSKQGIDIAKVGTHSDLAGCLEMRKRVALYGHRGPALVSFPAYLASRSYPLARFVFPELVISNLLIS